MKRFFVFVLCLFTGVVYAHTINWYVDDQLYQTTTCTIGDSVTPPTAPTKYGYTLRWYPNFTLIEYIEATGTQFINSGIYPNQDTKISITFYNGANLSGGLCGVSKVDDAPSASNPAYNCGGDYGDTRVSCVFDRTNYLNQKITYVRDKNRVTYYDENYNVVGGCGNNYVTFQMNIPLILFGYMRSSVSNIQGPLKAKVYSVKIWQNGSLVRDMIPVLDGGGVPCMFDIITQNFFYNIRTTSFGAGPAI